MKPPVYIDDDKALQRLAKRLASHEAIAVDTESNPLFAYRERLCLVQISTRTRDYLIDPLAGIDLTALVPVFADSGIVKVFHDAEFDVLMLRRVYPFEFSSIFDTRVVAAALGLTRLGLAAMLEEFFGVTLDKRYQRSDWGRRPLSEEQRSYACSDTHYLLMMAAQLRKRLHEAGELPSLEAASECRRLSQLYPEPKRFDPDEFVKIKGSEKLDPLGRRTLRELFVMRHGIAKRRDCPAFKVLSNQMLLELARGRPASREALARIKVVSHKLARRHGDNILAAVHRAERAGPLDRLPRPKPEPVDALDRDERELYEALRMWRKRTAMARPTESSLVLTRGCMLRLAKLEKVPRTVDELAATGLLEAWRIRYYGQELAAILEPFAD